MYAHVYKCVLIAADVVVKIDNMRARPRQRLGSIENGVFNKFIKTGIRRVYMAFRSISRSISAHVDIDPSLSLSFSFRSLAYLIDRRQYIPI